MALLPQARIYIRALAVLEAETHGVEEARAAVRRKPVLGGGSTMRPLEMMQYSD